MHTYAYECTCMLAMHTYACIFIRMHIYAYVYIHTYAYICIRMNICVCYAYVCMYIHTYAYICIRVYSYVCIYMHTYEDMCMHNPWLTALRHTYACTCEWGLAPLSATFRPLSWCTNTRTLPLVTRGRLCRQEGGRQDHCCV